MDGLTAKVFRTYNASITLQQQLKELTSRESLSSCPCLCTWLIICWYPNNLAVSLFIAGILFLNSLNDLKPPSSWLLQLMITSLRRSSRITERTALWLFSVTTRGRHQKPLRNPCTIYRPRYEWLKSPSVIWILAFLLSSLNRNLVYRYCR